MSKRYEIQYFDKSKVVHHDGIIQPGDMSLCGSDLMGDSIADGWYPATETNKPVSCIMCLRIVDHCQNNIPPIRQKAKRGLP